MKILGFIALILTFSVHAQVFPETEDTVNTNPNIPSPVNHRADTNGMASPPISRPMPVPPPFSDTYRSTPDTTPTPTTPTTPQPGFPGARMAPVIPVAPAVNLLDVFDKGTTGKLRGCSIVQRRRRGCEYEVMVEGRGYPFHSPDVCSGDRSAAQVGCNYGNHRENSACILNQALMIGYCR